MIRILYTLVVGLGIMVGVAVPAHAESFVVCPGGQTGVIEESTTCEFAYYIRLAYETQGGASAVVAYNPVTGHMYRVDCFSNTSQLSTGKVVASVECSGGNYFGDSIRVVFWNIVDIVGHPVL